MKNHLPIRHLTPLHINNTRNATQCYQAELSLTNGRTQPVFIKRLIPPYSDINYQQFCQEISTLQACQGLAIDKNTKKPPYGVPKILACDIDKNSSYLMLPLYHGESLKNLIKNNTLQFEQKVTLAISLCHGLDKIHCLGYLHGDVKSSNIFITTNNQVILLDFGLSQPLDNARFSDNTTAGTPAYMSPEQFNGLPLTPQSDYYSLGVLLFELFVGKLPFYANNVSDWAVAHCQHPVLVGSLLASFPYKQQKVLQVISGQLLAKLPNERCQSLSSLINMLSALAF